jgi:hypothetical protein
MNPFARHMSLQVQPSAEAPAVEPKPVEPTGNPFTYCQSNERRPKPERTRKPAPVPQLLYWLQHSWTKPIVCLRDVYIYGPNSIRDRKSALAQIELLEQAGWLIPLKAHRQDRRVWRVPMAGIGRNERKY